MSTVSGNTADSVSAVLQRLSSEVQQLHSKLEQCHVPVPSHAASNVVPSADSFVIGAPSSIQYNMSDFMHRYETQVMLL